MASDDKFRQYSEAGEDFLEGRSRAVDFLRELARVGQSSSKQAQGQVDDLVDAGRRSTEALLDVVRREIATQLGQLGLATKADLDALERRLGGRSGSATTSTPAKRAAAAGEARAAARPAPAAGAKKAPAKAAAAKATAKKAPAKRAAAKKAPAGDGGGTTAS